MTRHTCLRRGAQRAKVLAATLALHALGAGGRILDAAAPPQPHATGATAAGHTPTLVDFAVTGPRYNDFLLRDCCMMDYQLEAVPVSPPHASLAVPATACVVTYQLPLPRLDVRSINYELLHAAIAALDTCIRDTHAVNPDVRGHAARQPLARYPACARAQELSRALQGNSSSAAAGVLPEIKVSGGTPDSCIPIDSAPVLRTQVDPWVSAVVASRIQVLPDASGTVVWRNDTVVTTFFNFAFGPEPAQRVLDEPLRDLILRTRGGEALASSAGYLWSDAGVTRLFEEVEVHADGMRVLQLADPGSPGAVVLPPLAAQQQQPPSSSSSVPAPEPPKKDAYVLLTYSDGYVAGTLVAVASLLATDPGIGAERDIVVIVGCHPTGGGPFNVSGHPGGLPDYTSETCVPMISPEAYADLLGLERLRTDLHALHTSAASITTAFDGDGAKAEALEAGPSHAFAARVLAASTASLGPVIHIKLVPWLSFEPGVPIIGLNGGVWMKLHAWALTDYRCVTLLDADTIMARDLSPLFASPVCAAGPGQGYDLMGATVNPDALTSTVINVGVLVLRPSLHVWTDMTAHLAAHSRYQVVETTFLNWYFWDAKLALPPDILCQNEDIEDLPEPRRCYILDFTHCGPKRYKPWMAGPPPSKPGETCRRPPGPRYLALIDRWRELYAIAAAAVRGQ